MAYFFSLAQNCFAIRAQANFFEPSGVALRNLPPEACELPVAQDAGAPIAFRTAMTIILRFARPVTRRWGSRARVPGSSGLQMH
jgi:hypothetical protein